MPPDPYVNLARGVVTVAPSPADSGTAMEIMPVGGASFPDPSTDGPYDVAVAPAGIAATFDNTEMIRVLAGGGTVWSTVERGQQGSAARAVQVGDRVALVWSGRNVDDIYAAIAAGGGGFAVGSSWIRCDSAGGLPQSGLASGVSVNDALALGSQAGTDLAIDGVDNTKLNVLTTGWYSCMYQNDIYPTDAFLSVDISLNLNGAIIYGAAQDIDASITFYEYTQTLPPVLLTAGDYLQSSARAVTTAGTWTLDGTNDVIVVVRLS